jgi:hypothetical protein
MRSSAERTGVNDWTSLWKNSMGFARCSWLRRIWSCSDRTNCLRVGPLDGTTVWWLRHTMTLSFELKKQPIEVSSTDTALISRDHGVRFTFAVGHYRSSSVASQISSRRSGNAPARGFMTQRNAPRGKPHRNRNIVVCKIDLLTQLHERKSQKCRCNISRPCSIGLLCTWSPVLCA